jgi:microsomal epoxide hydrolase
VDQLQLAPVVLVGWSMGVIEVAAYVDQFGTDPLAGVVLVDGIAGGDFHPQFTPALLNFAGMHLKERQKMADDFVRSMYKNPAVLKDEAYIRRIKTASLRTPTNAAVALFVGAFTTDMRPALAKLNRPALIVSAPGGPFDPSYEDMARRIAGSRHVKFEGAGHALFVDEPEKFNALLDDFLSSLAVRVKER